MLQLCERTPCPNSPRRGDADAKRIKTTGIPGGSRGLGLAPTNACDTHF